MQGISGVRYWKFFKKWDGVGDQKFLKVAAKDFQSAKEAFILHTGEEPSNFEKLGHLCILKNVLDKTSEAHKLDSTKGK